MDGKVDGTGSITACWLDVGTIAGQGNIFRGERGNSDLPDGYRHPHHRPADLRAAMVADRRCVAFEPLYLYGFPVNKPPLDFAVPGSENLREQDQRGAEQQQRNHQFDRFRRGQVAQDDAEPRRRDKSVG